MMKIFLLNKKDEVVVEMKLVYREFYCRHCSTYESCKKYHRKGTAYLFLVENLLNSKKFGVAFSIGELEHSDIIGKFGGENLLRKGMSGCATYDYSHRTGGGWWYFTKPNLPISLDRIEEFLSKYGEQVPEISPIEQYHLIDHISKNVFFKILKNLDLKREDFKALLPSPEFFHLLKLYFVWLRERKYSFNDNLLVIEDIPLSFRRIITFDENLKFHTVKSSFYFTPRGGDYYDLVMRNNREIFHYFYDKTQQKITIYHHTQSRIFGYEKYREYFHPRCEIDYNRYRPYLFFHFRLGDILFIPENHTDLINEYNPAPSNSLEKIKVLNAKIEVEPVPEAAVPVLVPENNTPIIVFHPEHGSIQLEPAKYSIHAVPYLVRGHD